MFFLCLCLAFTALAFVLQSLFGDWRDVRGAFRHGLAGGFLLTGVDHFVHTQERYVPMMPPFLSSAATELVYVTGVAEMLGALGLVVPLAVYRRLGLPNLRGWAGFGLIALLASVVIANINVAVQAARSRAWKSEPRTRGCGRFCSLSSCCGCCMRRVSGRAVTILGSVASMHESSDRSARRGAPADGRQGASPHLI